jgi:hypothetical protein
MFKVLNKPGLYTTLSRSLLNNAASVSAFNSKLISPSNVNAKELHTTITKLGGDQINIVIINRFFSF